MQLNANNIEKIDATKVELPTKTLLGLPERVLQFGTGVLLRGLPDYFIDKANKQGIFNGRIVVVKSTDRGGTDAFDAQNGLYTQLERGYESGEKKEKVIVNASISRVLSATIQWNEILACATNPELQIIISNTTEVGITLITSDATADVPTSYPGKLLVFLLKRYEHFKGSIEAGMVIIPTELITDNGARLKAIVTELARLKGLSDDFIYWLHSANDFCSSLVDRIVPGKPSSDEQGLLEKELGYTDELMVMSETYRLWAIETEQERTKLILSFAKADASVVLASDINKFRELKLRLLNGAHTFSCGLAALSGFTTVKEAMSDEYFNAFISTLMLQEIAPVISIGNIGCEEAKTFALQVMDRFRNPYIKHQWKDIAVQYTSKMAMRNIPLIQEKYKSADANGSLMALGFAAYLLFMKPSRSETGKGYMNRNGLSLNDDKIELLFAYWEKQDSVKHIIRSILSDQTIWGTDLSQYPSFVTAVTEYYLQMSEGQNPLALIRSMTEQIPVA